MALAAALVVCGWAPTASAEGHQARPDYVPPGEYFPRGTWATGFAAKVQSSSFDRPSGASETRSSRYGILSRSGYFIANRFVVGIRASYDVALHRNTDTAGAVSIVLSKETEQSFEIGPWFRYYMPVGNGWALFGEADWSFRRYFDEEEFGGAPPRTTTGRGLAVGLGGGLTYFLTKAVAFDVAGRASFARLVETSGGRRTRADLSDFGLVLGFQIYLPEFVF